MERKSVGQYFIYILVGIGLMSLTNCTSFSIEKPPPGTLKYMHLLQAVIISLFIFILFQWVMGAFRGNESILPKSEIAQISFQQFSNSWIIVWILWLFLYIWNTVIEFKEIGDNWEAKFGTDVLNVLSTAALLICYLVLDKPSVKTKASPKRSYPFWYGVFAVTICSLIILWLSYFDRKTLVDASVGFNKVGIILNGIYAGLGIIFLAGRLDSHIIRLGRGWVAALYFYGLVQVFYGFHDALQDLDYSTYILVMLLKIVFFLTVLFLITNRSIANYLDESIANYETAPRSPVKKLKKGKGFEQPGFVHLARLLIDIYNEEELRRLPLLMPLPENSSSLNFDGREELRNAMPGDTVNQNTLAYTLAEAIDKRKYATKEFFEYLKSIRPNRANEIDQVQQLFNK